MTLRRVDSDTVALGPLDPFAIDLLRQIGGCARDDDPAARARLFPSPTNGAEQQLDRDWKSYVEPDLRRIFQSSLEVIEEDLEGRVSGSSSKGRTLQIPVAHLDAWIHGLNQARLAIVARQNFSSAELEGDMPLEGNERALALFQTHFYGFLQESFLRELGDT